MSATIRQWRQDHLSSVMELGRGFCLEAEQKKLNIGDATYRLQSSTTFRFRRYRNCSKNSNVNVQP